MMRWWRRDRTVLLTPLLPDQAFLCDWPDKVPVFAEHSERVAPFGRGQPPLLGTARRLKAGPWSGTYRLPVRLRDRVASGGWTPNARGRMGLVEIVVCPAPGYKLPA